MGDRSGELLDNFQLESLRNSFSNQLKIGLESFWSIPIWNRSGISFKINGKLVWRAPGSFPCGILQEFLSKSMGNVSGKLLVNFQIERTPDGIPIKINWELVWRSSGSFPYRILQEFLLKSVGNLSGELLVTFHMESLRGSFQNPWETSLESSWSISIWNP